MINSLRALRKPSLSTLNLTLNLPLPCRQVHTTGTSGHVRASSMLASTNISMSLSLNAIRCFSNSHTPTSLPSSTTTTTHSMSETPPPPPPLSKELWTLPNIITISRMCASPLLVYAIAHDMKTLALVGCVAGGASDWLDGYIAKNHNQMSVWGGILDPLADKVFIGCLASGLALQGLLPVPLLAAILGRDVFLVTCGLVFRAIERPPGAAFFDSDTATFEIIPTTLSKVNTALQFTLLGATLSHFAGMPPFSVDAMEPLWYLTGATTVLSGLQYCDGSGMKRIGGPTDAHNKRFTWK